MKRTKKAIILFAIFLAVAAAIKLTYSATGCCLNPNTDSACTEIENNDCCPDQASFPSYYLRNVTDKAKCNTYFFVQNTNCNQLNLCNTGCCCYSDSASLTYGAVCNETFVPSQEGRNCEEVCGIIIPPISSTCSPTLNLTAINIKGEKKIQLIWQSPCDSYSYTIRSCKGLNCRNFNYLDMTNDLNFTDSNESLLWNQHYTYNVTAKINDTYYSEIKSVYTGDIECWGKYTDSKFCVHEYLYNENPIKAYLISNLNYSGDSEQKFIEQVIGNYSSNFNSAMYCDDSNRLKSSSTRCSGNQVCAVSSNDQARCVERSDCAEIGKPFGMFSSKQACESLYCFYDKSQGNVKSCYDCSIKMSCYDYKSEASCETNNCGVGKCEWRGTNEEIGSGVCIDTQKNNCKWCDRNPAGTSGIESNRAYNEIFESCNDEKRIALSTPAFDCTKLATECNITCSQYGRSECQLHGIREMEQNNYINPQEINECGLNVCKWYGGVEYGTGICKKNADRDPKEDCTNENCEKDYYPPETGIRQEKQNLIITVIDKKSSTGYPSRIHNSLTNLCFKMESEQTTRCDNAAEFEYNTTQSVLSIQQLVNLGIVKNGKNIVSYFSIDENHNLEVVKTMTIDASALAPEGILSITSKDSMTGRTIVSNVYVDNLSNFKGISPLSTNIKTGNHTYILSKRGYREQTGNFEIQSGKITPVEVTMTLQTPPPNSGYLSVDAFDNLVDTRIMADLYVNGQLEGITPTTIALQPGPYSIRVAKEGYTEFTDTVQVIANQNRQINVRLMPESGPDGTGNFSAITTDAISKETITAEMKIDDLEMTYITPTTVTGLTPGIHKYNISKQGYYYYNGTVLINPSENQIINAVMMPESSPTILQINLVNPKLMATPTEEYDLIIATNKQATCKASTSNLPYQSMQWMFYSSGNIIHLISRLKTVNAPIYVKCKDFEGDVKAQTYTIQLVEGEPVIKVYASPSTILDPPIISNITAESNQDVVCKYSLAQAEYQEMTEFEGNNENIFETYKRMQTHTIIQGLADESTNTIYVMCKNRAGKLSSATSTTISINTKINPQITLHYKKYSSNKSVQIKAETSREAECILSNNSNYLSNLSFGPKGTVHVKGISFLPNGKYTYYVRCKFKSESFKEETAEFIIDDTPPQKPFVETEPTSSASAIIGHWNSTDNESGIKLYQYGLFEKSTDKQILRWINTSNEEETIRNLNLTKGTYYYIKATALNKADLWSPTGISDDVMAVQGPEHCRNRLKDSDETGIDCGGKECNKCRSGEACGTNQDCESGSCTNKTCDTVSCKDGKKNQNETDIDCGGENCKRCETALSCISNNDCLSSSCVNKKCTTSDTCANGKLDQVSESDIDCGKTCANKGNKCDAGKSCELSSDCKSGKCISSKCAADNDRDGDGKPDDEDNCPDTYNPKQTDMNNNEIGDDCEEEPKAEKPKENQFMKLLIWLFVIILLIGGLAAGYTMLKKRKAGKFMKEEKLPVQPQIQRTSQQIRIKPEVEQAIIKKREKDLSTKRKELLKSFETEGKQEEDVFSNLKKKTNELKRKK